MSQIHYLPLTPGFFAILVGIFVIVLILRSEQGSCCTRLECMLFSRRWRRSAERKSKRLL